MWETEPRCQAGGEDRGRQQAGRGHASAVDDEADELALRQPDAEVGRPCRRRRRRVDPLEAHLAGEPAQSHLVERDLRTVVDDDDLVVVDHDVALVSRRERGKGAGQFPLHVVGDDHEAE